LRWVSDGFVPGGTVACITEGAECSEDAEKGDPGGVGKLAAIHGLIAVE
jgi:hypothetical protein